MGEVFAGRYELLDPLGEGGMGTVWRVWDTREERIVAAKVLRQSDAVSLLRFVREQAFRVDHPHVLTPLGWAGDDDRVLFTMPVVDGGSVASLIGDHGTLPALLVAELLRQLASALDAVHRAGILHRDVKPANVLLAATGSGRPHAFLSDFGIAIELDGVRLTQTGQWSGTPSFSAPESQLGAEPHPSSDLYAVGQVGLAMLTGERPSTTPQRPAGVPDELWDLLADLTRREPAERPQTAHEVLGRLGAPSLRWAPGAMGEVEVFRHVPEPSEGTDQLRAVADSDPEEDTRTDPEQTGRTKPARAAVLGGVLVVAAVALVVALVAWAPWSADGDSSQPTPTPTAPRSSPPPSSPPASSPPASSPPPSPSTTTGSVDVGSVVVTVGQPCQFSDVGVREETVDGASVVCQRRSDGSYAWDPPPG